MQTRELQNGRLAMIGVAGMCAQELVNHRTIMETFVFYQKIYSGVDPYAAIRVGGPLPRNEIHLGILTACTVEHQEEPTALRNSRASQI
mmetsp:Transcript_9757/g.13660  ORF Transcript_9757/g.13660 Transcript_9757/m.13660 type:complete len:89 (-) Transcript_9757:62-328(-)